MSLAASTAPALRDGTTQAQRSLPALRAPFQVDALQLDELLALARRMAARLHFVDLHGHAAGSWEPLFQHDGTLLLADIASFPRRAWLQEQARLCQADDPVPAAGSLLALAEHMDTWLVGLEDRAHPSVPGPADATALPGVLEALGQAVRGQLAPQLAWVLRSFGGWPRGGAELQRRAQRLSAPWHKAAGWEPHGQHKRRQLRTVGQAFAAALGRLQVVARERLPQTLDGGHHEPAVGLLLAFLRLYGQVQQQTNALGSRHLDFYHREVLGFEPRPAEPDRVHVALRAASHQTEPVRVPAGTVFLAGKDGAGRPVRFCNEAEGRATRAAVAALATLRQERADDVQPESDLGFVTAVRAQVLGLPGVDAPPVPAFGGGADSHDATLGLAIASPLLLLKEGQRRMDLELQLEWPGPSVQRLLRLALGTRNGEVFRCAAGQLYARWLLGDEVALSAEQRQQLRQCAQRHQRHARSLEAMLDEPTAGQDRRQMEFHRVVGDLFELSLTHASGWLQARRVQLDLPQGHAGGLRLTVRLTEEDPAITGCDPAVHGQDWPTRLPVLRLLVSPRARIHPLSLFLHAALARVALSVRVHGVRDLVVQNQLGPLDASKVFAPFGPLPSTSSALVVGSPEAAAKNLDELGLSLEWSGLPADGLRTHYAAYGAEQAEGPFTVALSLLRDGVWRPCGGDSARQPLFAAPGPDGREPALQEVAVHPLSVRENARASLLPLDAGVEVRDGLLRLQLQHPRTAFGHQSYAGLLSEAVSTRTRTRARRRAPMPQAPYTPELQSLRLHYRASTTLDALARTDTRAATRGPAGRAGEDVERLLHLHPFGVSALRRDAQGRAPGVLPALGADGNLFIGLSLPPDDEGLVGPLTLLFQMRPRGAATLPAEADRAPVHWSFLAGDRWQPLGHRHVLSDTTFGLLGSGIVTLDLPRGARRDNVLLGQGLFWLCVSGRRQLDATAELISVHAHGLTLKRVMEVSAPSPEPLPPEPLPAGQITQPESPVPGLAGVLQPEAATGLRTAETSGELRQRVAERLRHKNRACLAWDYERLVLAHAPGVFKAKCFMPPTAGLAPGEVLVAVLPAAVRNSPALGAQPLHLDVLALRQLEALLRERSSPMVRLRVRNVSYERVQVRCRVQMARHAQPGSLLRTINQALVRYLSPWHDEGFGPQLDWQLRCEDVQAALRRVPGVAGVTGLSLLHVVCDDDGRYHFGDTAAPGAASRDMLRARHPWSVVLPLEEHIIELADELHGTAPRQSGLTQLEVGETFVMGQAGAAEGVPS